MCFVLSRQKVNNTSFPVHSWYTRAYTDRWDVVGHCTVIPYIAIVTLGLGVCLDLRFLGVVLVLGFLLLPPAMQMCGKRVL